LHRACRWSGLLMGEVQCSSRVSPSHPPPPPSPPHDHTNPETPPNPTPNPVQWAQVHHGNYPYVAAYDSADELELLRSEAAAAAKACTALAEKEEWVPPPPDDEPETAADYE
jgi:hypothetical protein